MKSETIYEIMLSVLSGEATADERCLLDEWLARSEANRRQYEQVGRLYRSFPVTAKQDASGYDVEQAWKAVSSRTVRKKTFDLKRWLPYAALVAVVLSAGVYWMGRPVEKGWTAGIGTLENISQPTLLLENGERIPLKQDSFSIRQGNMMVCNHPSGQLSYKPDHHSDSCEEESTWNHLAIPKGNAYELELADGTHVWLNAESELSYPTRFTGDVREVRLKGEAFFDVAKNPDCPFVVRTDEVAVRVLGTSFNVSSYRSEQTASVTLVRGAVSVQADGGEAFRMAPSEQFRYDKESHESDIHVVDTDLYTSWIKGEYIFRDTPLDKIFDKLSHWYDFSVRYQDNRLRNKRFSFVVDRTISLEQLLDLVSFTSDVKLEQGEGKVIYVKQEKREEVR